MFQRLWGNSVLSRWMLRVRLTLNPDPLLEQLQVCSAEDQVFEVVGKNKAKLTGTHVGCAVGMLWQFQQEKPQILRTVELIKSHPEFLTLRVLAENNISLLDDVMLVDILYSVLRFEVECHDSLVQQLVSEAWLRIDRFPMDTLSKFGICLNEQKLHHSPLMGHIANILDQKLSSVDHARILTAIMLSVSSFVSPRLRDKLLSRADHLLDTMNPRNYNSPRRVVQFLRNIKYRHQPLLEKCNQLLLPNVMYMDAEEIFVIMSLFQSLHFSNWDFKLAVRQRLIELIDSSTDPLSFTKLFVTLAPMASPQITQGLENTALLLADEFSSHEALDLAHALALPETRCRNRSLINKIASIIKENLHVYNPIDMVRITKALFRLHYQNPELWTKLRNMLVKYQQESFVPSDVISLTHALLMLPSPRLDESLISRVDAVLPQCNLADIHTLAMALAKLVPSDQYRTATKYVRLLQTLTRCGHERLHMASQLDLLLDELRYIFPGKWFEELLLEKTMVTLQRMTEQISWTNVPGLAHFLSKTRHLCPPLMDRIASVAVTDIDKIHHRVMIDTLRPFALLNYHPPGAEELYDVCIQRIIPHMRSFDPHLLVLLGHTLAVANRFPEELIRDIFNIDFLGRLDAELETKSDVITTDTRLRLMELNRAVCLESPEFQVPWFHEGYFQHLQRKGNGFVGGVQKQIHRMLGEVLGGINCARAAVLTPYFYTVDFECVLDKNKRPVAYSEPITLPISDRGKLQWGNSSLEQVRNELPPGAQRVAVDFLDANNFCKHSRHLKGIAVMRKRHLEILGYHVVQIPHFEWNSMELSTQDAWKEYLKKKIFIERSP